MASLPRRLRQLFGVLSRRLRTSTVLRRLPLADAVHTWLWQRLRAPGPVRVDGYTFHLHPRSAMSKKLELYGSLAALENHLALGMLREGDVVLDIGAHAGVFAVPASDAVGPTGRVVAFEPNPNILPLLRRNLRDNGCENVSVEERAVTDASERAVLTEHERSVGFASLRSFGGETASFEVETVSVDAYVEQSSVRPDLIKVDVEGAEGLVLAGTRQTLKGRSGCVLVLELHPLLRQFGHEASELLTPLERRGYRLHRIVDGETLEPTSAEAVGRRMAEEAKRIHLLCVADPGRLPRSA